MGAPAFRRFGTHQGDTLPGMEDVATATPSDKPKPARTNKYPSKCADCEGDVPANEGSLSNQNGNWVVRHFPECPPMALEAAARDNLKPEVVFTQVTAKDGKVLFDGTYTYETTTSYRTFRLRTQGLDESFMPGTQIIQYLTGPDNERDYESIGHVTTNGSLRVWKRHQGKVNLVKDAEAFMVDPHGPNVLASVACYRCGRKLTVPTSVHNGLGPDCAKEGF